MLNIFLVYPLPLRRFLPRLAVMGSVRAHILRFAPNFYAGPAPETGVGRPENNERLVRNVCRKRTPCIAPIMIVIIGAFVRCRPHV